MNLGEIHVFLPSFVCVRLFSHFDALFVCIASQRL